MTNWTAFLSPSERQRLAQIAVEREIIRQTRKALQSEIETLNKRAKRRATNRRECANIRKRRAEGDADRVVIG